MYVLHHEVCHLCMSLLSLYSVGERAIKRLKVECVNHCNGCEFVGELGQHDATCDFSLLPCPNKCTDQQNKITMVMRKDMEKHKMECPNRPYECPHSKETGGYHERTTKHLQECEMLEDACPNEGCTEKVLRCDLPKHRQECPHEIVLCKYAYRGCDVTLPREEMIEHQKDSQSHAHLSRLKHKQWCYCVNEFNWRKSNNRHQEMHFSYRYERLKCKLDLNRSSGKTCTYLLKTSPLSFFLHGRRSLLSYSISLKIKTTTVADYS